MAGILLLMRYKNVDANVRPVCNDATGNVADQQAGYILATSECYIWATSGS